MSSLNAVAQAFRALHKPGNPIVLTNVYDGITANAIASMPSTQALATASYAVANAAGLEDNDMDMETNLRAAKIVASVAKKFQKPLTVDFQDGYGDKLEEGIKRLVEIGAVGINLEDYNKDADKFYSIEEAADRVKRALSAAASAGVPDFVVNARVDELVHDGTVDSVVMRGKRYLAAGAANIFVLKNGNITREEVAKLVSAFEGKLNVNVKKGGLGAKQLAELGVARCSIGPMLSFVAAEAAVKAAQGVLDS